MRLKNKKTGEIKDFALVVANGSVDDYSLTKLNEEWEDAPEEPKEWWYIDIHGPHKVTNNDGYYQQVKAASKEIGNYFETKEEAEQAVEKLKAWKRLKDKGFELTGFDIANNSGGFICGQIYFKGGKTDRVNIIPNLEEICEVEWFGGEK